MRVSNFLYCNGVYAERPNFAKFTAEFVSWTDEKEVALCKCSHGKMVKIPSFALEGFNSNNYPAQTEQVVKSVFNSGEQMNNYELWTKKEDKTKGLGD